MDVIFKSSERQEIMRLAKSLDMACFIFELLNNTFDKHREEPYTRDEILKEITELLQSHSIDIDDIIS